MVWISRPSLNDYNTAEVGVKNFFCGRKGKFGLNLQGVCDVRGRFLDVTIAHPGSTSDYLSFVTSCFCQKLETPGYLAPNIVIYGDAEYICNGYMVTPFKNVSFGKKDHFNFYHSQVRIRIECAFGILVFLWAILRKPFHSNTTLRRVTALTYYLCKLHNYFIDQKEMHYRE